MLPFADYFFPVLFMALLIALYDGLYPFFKSKISKTQLFSHLLIGITSGCAIYYTHGKSMLLPVFVINAYVWFQAKPSQNQAPKIPYALMFLGFAGFLYLLQYVYILGHPSEMLIANQDHYFYVNKMEQISSLGVESVVAHQSSDTATFYHFFDLWLLKPLSCLSQNPNILYIMLYMPLGFTLVYSHLIDLMAGIKNTKLSKLALLVLALVPFIKPLQIIIHKNFGLIDPCWTSVYAYAKTLVLLWLMLLVFKAYWLSKNPYQIILLALLSGLAFVTILPAMWCFAGVYYLYALKTKQIEFKSKSHGILLLLGLSTVAYLWYLYAPATSSSEQKIGQVVDTPMGVKIKYLWQSLCFLLTFLLYFVPVFINPWSKIKASFKAIGCLVLMPLGGLLASFFLNDKVPNANQFYALSLLGFMTLAIPITWHLSGFKKWMPLAILGLLYLSLHRIDERPVMLRIDKDDYQTAQQFTQKYPVGSKIAFIMPAKWHPDALCNLEDFFAPSDILSGAQLPIDAYWLENYHGGIDKKDKFYDYSLNLLQNTVFAKYQQKHADKTLFENQADFVQAQGIKTLIVGNIKALSPILKTRIIDSAEIKHKNVPGFPNLQFKIYQLK
jgi:hypothetical protein